MRGSSAAMSGDHPIRHRRIGRQADGRDPNQRSWIAGGVIFAVGMVFALPVFAIRPITGPAAGVSLKTRGLYRIVRNPLYLSDVLWCLGLAVMFRSEVGIALVPVWWAALWLLTMIEEESLERTLGQPYIEYKQRVRGRIVPGLPL
jgi:protein-S-isoprenylcysteine O-methyltransferase Ste14